MLYNYFSGAIPYPSLHFGSFPTQSNHSDSMGTPPVDEGIAEQLTNIETNGDHSNREELLPDDQVGTEAGVPEAVSGSVESALQHALATYNYSSDTSQEQQHDTVSNAMDIDTAPEFPPLAESYRPNWAEATAPPGSAMSFTGSQKSEHVNVIDHGVLNPCSVQTDIVEHDLLEHTDRADEQTCSENKASVSETFDQLLSSQLPPKDGFDIGSGQTASTHDVSSIPLSATTTDVVASLDLSNYQPGSIPAFKGRARSTTPPPTKKYDRFSAMANWPPPSPESVGRIDIFPPSNAPLHVWIQAYALRWGVWAAEIKDVAVRDRVLEAVTDKMRISWDTAIREGYYLKPDPADVTSDQERGESDVQTKKGRKRAQSPSKVSAGFASEGRDKFAITNGELAKHGITMKTINQRVENKDFDVGELRYDEVLQNMDSDVITIRDWSASLYGSVQNRNLLMYCFWVVQEERRHLARLTVLYNKFSKDHQKKNTKIRMDGVREREHQHMALATELSLREQAVAKVETEMEHDVEDAEIVPNESTSEADGGNQQEPVSAETSDAETLLTKSQVMELAHAIFATRTEDALHQAFTSRGLRPGDMTLGGLTVDAGEDELVTVLAEIFAIVDQSIRISRQSRTQQPSEVIKINHDLRIMHANVYHLRQKLYGMLQSLSKLPPLADLSMLRQESTVNVGLPQPHTSEPTVKLRGSKINEQSGVECVDEDSGSFAAAESPSDFTSNQGFRRKQQSGSSSFLPQISSVAERSRPAPPLGLKKLFIHERWVPSLNRLLAQHSLPPVQGELKSWNPVKDILQHQLGWSTDERNAALQNFKEGYREFLEEKGLVPGKSDSESPAPSLNTKLSPDLSHDSVKSPPLLDWPTEAEIASVIPSQGIPAAELMQIFAPRVASDRARFVATLKNISRLDESNYRVYPKQRVLPPLNRQYNMLPPTPVTNLQSTQQSGATSLVPARNKVVKLKIPQPSTDSFDSLPAQDESNFPPEYKSREVNSSRGFSFRHLPHATLEQRQRMDQIADDYIQSMTKGKKKGRWGQYITFKDPQNSGGPAIAHGFWDMSAKQDRAPGTEWFYSGKDMPAGWTTESVDDASQGPPDQNVTAFPSTTEQTQPRLKLKVSKPTDSQKQRASTPAFQPNMKMQGSAQQQNFNTMHTPQQYSSYNGMPPNFNYNSFVSSQPQQTGGMRYPQDFNTSHPATIDPALLMTMNTNQSTAFGSAESATGSNGHNEGVGSVKRGTKRSAPAAKVGSRKRQKRRSTIVPDDDDEDEDYDPSQDY